ncbi:unnamed protein product [Peniophora sp. CBMAI 1063]|nr:unnamed protein product [Peniophora sp. CBMAI 1063]
MSEAREKPTSAPPPSGTGGSDAPPAYDVCHVTLHLPILLANSHSLAQNGLPVETLQQIFVCIPVTQPHKRDELPSQLVPLHVCRIWRAAALSCEELWTATLPLSNTTMTTLALERSMNWNAMLCINAFPGTYMDPDALSVALGEPSRVEELTCPATRESHGIMKEAVHLRSFNIWEEGYVGVPLYKPGLPYGDYREAAAFGGTVGLRLLEELRLHGDRIRISASLLRDLPLLTALELTLPQTVWPTLDVLLNALATMPQLKSLALRDAVLPTGSNLDHDMPNAQIMVHLNYMEQLCLTGSPALLSCMLHQLSIPRCTRISFILRFDVGGQDGIWDTQRRLDQRIVQLFAPRLPDEYPLEHLTLHVYDGVNEKNSFWKNPSNATDMLSKLPCLRTLDLRFGLGESGTAAPYRVLLPMLMHLHICAPPHILATASEAIRTPHSTYRSYAIQLADISDLAPGEYLSRLLSHLYALNHEGFQASYTRLDIAPARDNPAGCLRFVASGLTAVRSGVLPPIVDISLEESELPLPYQGHKPAIWPPVYGEALHALLVALPLDALDEVFVADGVDSIRLAPHDTTVSAFTVPLLLQRLLRARSISIAFYAAAAFPFLEAALQSERLEHISLQSMAIGDDLAGIKLLPRLCTTAKSQRILVSVRNCEIAERDVRLLQSWAGSDNFDWDERQVVDCTPSWGAGDSPWLAPDAREMRFWRPDLWSSEFRTLGDGPST